MGSARKLQAHTLKDPVTRFIEFEEKKNPGGIRQCTGLSDEKISEFRNDPSRPIKFIDVLRLIRASRGQLSISDFQGRTIPDWERFDNPLGRKIALSASREISFSNMLADAGITHAELIRWISENTRWNEETKRRIRNAFERDDIKITEDDFEEHHVERLRQNYETARRQLERRRACR